MRLGLSLAVVVVIVFRPPVVVTRVVHRDDRCGRARSRRQEALAGSSAAVVMLGVVVVEVVLKVDDDCTTLTKATAGIVVLGKAHLRDPLGTPQHRLVVAIERGDVAAVVDGAPAAADARGGVRGCGIDAQRFDQLWWAEARAARTSADTCACGAQRIP